MQGHSHTYAWMMSFVFIVWLLLSQAVKELTEVLTREDKRVFIHFPREERGQTHGVVWAPRVAVWAFCWALTGLGNPMDGGAWWAAVHGVTKSLTRLSTFTFHFHALEEEMATYSSVLAWRIPRTGEPDGLPSMGSHRVGHNWSDLAVAAAAMGKLQDAVGWAQVCSGPQQYPGGCVSVRCGFSENRLTDLRKVQFWVATDRRYSIVNRVRWVCNDCYLAS